jgi:hypothetical protein
MSEENETDNIARQNAELDLIEAIYPSEFFRISTDVAKVVSPPSKPLADGKQSPSFGLRLEHKVTLQFTLPAEYPCRANPIVTFNAPHLSKNEHHSLQTALNARLAELASSSEERILDIVEFFTTSIPEPSSPTPTDPPSSKSESPSSSTIVLIWFHHLLSTTKRKDILALPSLRGISKPGYPGILVLQGPKGDVDDAIAELKGMRWQAMQVRAELEGHDKVLEEGVHEVESVAEVVDLMDRLELGDWCLSALRMK